MRMTIRNPIGNRTIEVNARSTKKPSFKVTKNKTWDTFPIWVNYEGYYIRTKIHINTTSGRNGYINIEDRWYAIPIEKLMEIGVM